MCTFVILLTRGALKTPKLINLVKEWKCRMFNCCFFFNQNYPRLISHRFVGTNKKIKTLVLLREAKEQHHNVIRLMRRAYLDELFAFQVFTSLLLTLSISLRAARY